MASKTKKLRAIRKRKHSPNNTNLKADMKRTQTNREILRQLAAKDEA